MAYKRTWDEQPIPDSPPCFFLRSKAIYVTGDPDPRPTDDPDSTRFNCWCNKTQYEIGPDEELVNRATCIQGRHCFTPRA